MQKAFLIVALALTLTSALAYSAGYTVTNYAKAPVVVAVDTDTNYTNQTFLSLASINIGELDLVSSTFTTNTANASATAWSLWYRKLDGKALTYSANSTATFTAPLLIAYVNNYAISISTDNDTGIPQVRVYQTPVTGGAAALPRLTVSSNNNASFTPQVVGTGAISKTAYVFYTLSGNKVNVTNFVIGGAVGTLEFTFSTTFDTPLSLSLTWGESLTSSQLFASWIEAGVLKDSVVDVSKGTVTPVTVGAYDKSYSCSAYATDKKWYGDLCTSTNLTAGTIAIYVRSNTTSLAPLPLTNSFLNTSSLSLVVPYGPYLALFYRDSVTTAGATTYTYEIWNLDTYTTFKNRTQVLTIQPDSTVSFFRVVSGGLYTLLYNNRQQLNGTLTSVQVGLVLGGSYLTTIFGFLLTIIAGLLLF